MKAVVVGGRGFLGSAVVAELLCRGDTVTILDPRASQAECDETLGVGRVEAVRGDMLAPAELREHFAGTDEVYHMGGKLGTSELDESVHDAIAANITGAVNVFESAIAAGVPTVFYPTKPNVWLNTYTVTKVAAEQFARIFSEQHAIHIRSLRYFNAYGPGQALGPVRKIIPIFAARALNAMPLIVYGDGEQTVDMIYSDDIGRITVDFSRSNYDGPAVDCGRGEELTVNAVAAAVNEIVGNPQGVRHVAMRRGETEGTKLVADIKPLCETIPSLQFSDWMSTLSDTIDWYAALGRDRLVKAAGLA
jgi:UDP-glucose 4-epimerase